MKEILYFMLPTCPHCKRANGILDELKKEDPKYDVPMTVIDENSQSDIADKYDYWYVPCFFVDGVKLHEGAATKDKLRAVLDAALA